MFVILKNKFCLGIKHTIYPVKGNEKKLDEIFKVATTGLYLMDPYCGNEIMFMGGAKKILYFSLMAKDIAFNLNFGHKGELGF